MKSLRAKCSTPFGKGHRLLRNLAGSADESVDYSGNIVVAKELFPSELIKIHAQHAEGAVLLEGGMTAMGRAGGRWSATG